MKKRYKRIDPETGELGKQLYILDEEVGTLNLREYTKRNYMIKEFPDGKREVIYFPLGFMMSNDVICDPDLICDLEYFKEIDPNIGARKWKLDDDGNLMPIEGRDGSITDLINTAMRSGKRAQVSFYEYALANFWEYFATFTFAKEEVRKNNYLISDCWKNFRKSMQYRYPNFKAIGVIEPFDKGGYHLHFLMANCDLILQPARNNNTESDYYKMHYYNNGRQVFNIMNWKYGYSTVECITPDSNQTQVVNYCTKYLQKFKSIGYNANKYYRTQNLDTCKVVMGFAGTSRSIRELIANYGLISKKILKGGAESYANWERKKT